jgi:hypothetical protein
MATALLLPAQIALKQSGFRATALKCASASQDSQQHALHWRCQRSSSSSARENFQLTLITTHTLK